VHAVGPGVDVTFAFQGSLAPLLELPLPRRLEPGERGGREPRSVRAEQGLEGLGEVAGADALEVEPGDQLVETLGPLQVRRQDRRGELLTLIGGPAVMDPGLLDLVIAKAGLDLSIGQVAVADDLESPRLIFQVGIGVGPGGNLGLDGLGQEPPGLVAEDVGQDILGARDWPGDRQGSRLSPTSERPGNPGESDPSAAGAWHWGPWSAS
jgi:hypothetical protein